MNTFLTYVWAAVFAYAAIGLLLLLAEPALLALRAHRTAVRPNKGK